MIHRHPLLSTLLAGAFLLSAAASHASLLYHVSVDTSSLINNPASPFYLDFQFNDGAAFGDGNNSVILSNFDFGVGGSAFNGPTDPTDPSSFVSPLLTPGASGSAATSFTITDTEAYNEVIQAFLPGSLLKFDLTLPSTNLDLNSASDLFVFAIYYTDPTNGPTLIPTLDPGDSLLSLTVDSNNPTPQTFAVDDSQNSGLPPGIAAFEPSVVLEASVVPEPTTALAGVALLGLCAASRRRSRATASVLVG